MWQMQCDKWIWQIQCCQCIVPNTMFQISVPIYSIGICMGLQQGIQIFEVEIYNFHLRDSLYDLCLGSLSFKLEKFKCCLDFQTRFERFTACSKKTYTSKLHKVNSKRQNSQTRFHKANCTKQIIQSKLNKVYGTKPIPQSRGHRENWEL